MTAGLWLFLFRVLLAPFQRKPEQAALCDPETLLQQAQQEMRENQAKNRERAVQAITQKNNLQAELDKTQKIVNNLQAKATKAAHEGDGEAERQLLIEAEAYQATLTRVQDNLERAVKTTEAIKVAVRREEGRIRAKTAQAMATKALWKQSQIASHIPDDPTDLAPDYSGEAAYEQAQSWIEFLQSREVKDLRRQTLRTSSYLLAEAERALAHGDRNHARRLLTERGLLLSRSSFLM